MVSPVICLNEDSGREAVRVKGLQGLGKRFFPSASPNFSGGGDL